MDYGDYHERLAKYISSSWEISGTFVVFYLVNFEATFPGLLVTVGTLYLAPILLAGAVIIIRDAFLAYSEYTPERKTKQHDSKIYAASTLVAAFFFTAILGSAISGIGINVGALSINLLGMLFNPFDILIFVGLAATALISAFVMFDVRRVLPFILVSVLAVVAFVSALLYVPYIAQSFIGQYYLNIFPALLFLALAALYLKRSRHAKLLVFPWLIVSALVFLLFEYPGLFGGALNVDNYLTSGASAFYVLLISGLGAVFLAVSIGFLLYAKSRSDRSAKKRKVY